MVSADPLCVAPPRSSLLEHSHSHGSRAHVHHHHHHHHHHLLLDTPAPQPASSPTPAPPRKREVTSRYLSPAPTRRASVAYVSSFSSVTRRFPSPAVDRTPNVAPSSKRAVSVERRRPSPLRTTPEPKLASAVDNTTASKRAAAAARSEQLLWPSTRSPHLITPSESYSPSQSPAKTRSDSRGRSSSSGYLTSDHTLKPSINVAQRLPANVAQRPLDLVKEIPDRKGSPLRRQSFEQAENSRPSENIYTKQDLQHRWPSSSRLYGASLSKSVDLTGGRERFTSRATSMLLQAKALTSASRGLRPSSNSGSFSQSINIEGPSSPALRTAARKLNLESRPKSKESPVKTRRGTPVQTDRYLEPVRQSDDEVAQLASEDTLPEAFRSSYVDAIGTMGTKSIQGATISTRLLQDASSRPRNANDYAMLKSGQGFATSSPWSGLPNHTYRVTQRSYSPAKLHPSFPARSWPSPTRPRVSSMTSPISSLPRNRPNGAATLLSFGADARRGKKGLTQAEAAFLHRILHNRFLQWRFVNARAELAANTQRLTGEKLLFSVWAKTTELLKSVTTKRMKLQQARHAHKLNSILKAQGPKLKEWSSIQHAHSSALSSAVGALEAAVLRLPVDDGVKADTHAIKEAMASAIDVVHAVESSAAELLPKMDKTTKLVSELAQVADRERTLMKECGNLLLHASSLEIEECSLKMHLVQFEQEKARVLGHLIGSGNVSGASSV